MCTKKAVNSVINSGIAAFFSFKGDLNKLCMLAI